MPQEQPPHICPCRAIHVSKLTLTSTTTPRGKILIHENDSSFFYTSHKHLWDGKSHSEQYPYGTWVQNSKMSVLANFQTTVKKRWQNSVQWFSVFQYHDSWKNTGKIFCIRIAHVIKRSGIKCCLSKWRHRIKSQSWTTIILLANNIVAIIHLFQYNKYQLSTFLLEPLAKKVCSVSFVSQYSCLVYIGFKLKSMLLIFMAETALDKGRVKVIWKTNISNEWATHWSGKRIFTKSFRQDVPKFEEELLFLALKTWKWVKNTQFNAKTRVDRHVKLNFESVSKETIKRYPECATIKERSSRSRWVVKPHRGQDLFLSVFRGFSCYLQPGSVKRGLRF